MRTTKPRTLEIGTIIHGTMRVQDTMPALLSALDGIALSAKDRRKCNELQRDLDAWSSDDGSDLGVWPCEEIFDDTRQGSYDGFCWRLRENNHHPDEESIPADMSHALAVNGRGNATLYARGQDGWTECWSLV
jgi:hypothetical protein